MSPWREVWADFVHEWRVREGWRRAGVVAGLVAAMARMAVASMIRGSGLWGGLGADLRYAWRRLAGSRVYFGFGVATLAIVLTVAPTIHAVLASFLWQPTTVEHPDRVVQVVPGTRGYPGGLTMSWGDWLDFSRNQRTFESVTAALRRHATALTTSSGVIRVMGESVTPGFFQVLRTPMVTGRPLVADDFTPDAEPAVILAERTARRTFGDAASAHGRQIDLGGRTFTVVGVAPEGFRGMGTSMAPPEYWIPLEQARLVSSWMTTAYFDPARRNAKWLEVRGRLASSATLEHANMEARQIGAAIEADVAAQPEWNGQAPGVATRQWSAQPAADRDADLFAPLAMAILTAVGLVVALACTNLANLGLSRSSWRQHDLWVRRSLGASRWRLVRAQVMETVIIVGVAVVIAAVAIRALLTRLTMEIPIAQGFMVWMEPTITPTVVLGTAAAALLCLLVAGLWPALRASRATAPTASVSTGRLRLRLQRALIALQVTGSAALLTLTVSVIDATTRSLPDPGVDLDRLGLASVDLVLTPRDEAQQLTLRDGVLAALARTPGIESATVSDTLPFGQMSDQAALHASDETLTSGKGLHTYAIQTTEGFWSTLGIPLVAGRGLSADDVQQRREVVVISRKNALELFGTERAVGRRVWISERVGQEDRTGAWEVVGVSADTDVRAMGSRATGLIVRPLVRQPRSGAFTVSARASDPSTAVAAIRQAVASVDRTVMVSGAASGWTALAGPYYFAAVLGWISLSMGVLTLVLVMTGLYGVLATTVAQGRREMAIRLALGSTREQLIRRVVAAGARPAVVGLVLGLGLGMLFRLGARALLPAFSVADLADPVGLTVLPVVVAVATFAATYLPARRAAAIDPNVVLRQE